MKVIANSGPIIALAKLGLLGLLKELYGPIVIPLKVYDEVVIKGQQRGEDDAKVVGRAINLGLIIVEDISEASFSEEIKLLPLHGGEKAVIHLSLELQADIALLDDKLARDTAKNFGIKIKGTLGVIIDGYRKRLLTENDVNLLFNEIIARDDIWIARPFVDKIRDEFKNI